MEVGRVSSLVVSCILAALVSSGPAYATLGGNVASIEQDRIALNGTSRGAKVANNYSVYEIDFGPGPDILREYVNNATGIVYALAWEARAVQPNLVPLLGTYASIYAPAMSHLSRVHGRRTQNIKTPTLVVQEGGHQRHLVGRAFDPTLRPEQVTGDEIQ